MDKFRLIFAATVNINLRLSPRPGRQPILFLFRHLTFEITDFKIYPVC